MRLAVAPLTALVTVAALTLAPACGFPTLSYDDDGGTSSGGSSGSSGGSSSGTYDAASDGAFTGDAEPPGDGSSGGVGDGASGDGHEDSNDSSTPPPDAGGDGSIDCDQDHDGYLSNSAQCGGNDCCDTDANAHPGQTAFFTTVDVGCMSWDYNCDGTQEMEWGAFACSPGVTGCTVTAGFVGGVPGCGVPEQFASACKNNITSCQAQSTTSQTQACH
jgi:hypothetical protein